MAEQPGTAPPRFIRDIRLHYSCLVPQGEEPGLARQNVALDLEGAAWLAELHRLRRVFLSAMGATTPQMKLPFAQQSERRRGRSRGSLQKRAEGKPGLRSFGAGVHEKSAVNLRDF